MPAKRNSTRRQKVNGHQNVYYRIGGDGRRQYEVTYLDSDGKRRWVRVQGDLNAADGAIRAIKVKLDQGQKVIPSKRPFEEIAWEWYEREKDRLRPNTARNYESALRLHIIPRLGRCKVAEITEDRVAALIRDMEKAGKATSTIRNALAPLSRILNHATRNGMIQGNPINRLERPERPQAARKHAKRVLDREEARGLLDSAKGHYRLLLALALNTGLRQSEILGLRWSNIDFKGKRIIVDGQLDRARTENGEWLPTKRVEFAKTDAGNRTVELIPSDLFKSLREFKVASAHSTEADFIFATKGGGPLDHRNVAQRGLGSAIKRAKLNGAGKPNLRFHDLRHTYASANISAGVDVVYLSRQLGHTNPSVTLNVYADLFEAREKADQSRKALENSGYRGLV